MDALAGLGYRRAFADDRGLTGRGESATSDRNRSRKRADSSARAHPHSGSLETTGAENGAATSANVGRAGRSWIADRGGKQKCLNV